MLAHQLLLPTLVQPLLDEPTNLFIRSERQSPLMALQGLVVAAEPTKHIGASEVERRVLLQCAGVRDVLQQRKALEGIYSEGEASGRIQLDARGALVARELFVRDCDLPPLRARRRRCSGINRRNRALDLIGTWP